MKVSKIFENYFSSNEYEEDEDCLVIGVIGEVSEDEDESNIYEMIDNLVDDIMDEFDDFEDYAILGDVKSNKLLQVAFKIAEERGFKTVGLVINDDETDLNNYPVDDFLYCETDNPANCFSDNIDVLIKVGNNSFTDEVLNQVTKEEIPIFEENI